MKYLPIIYICLLLFTVHGLQAQSDFEKEITEKFFELPEVSQKAVLVFSEKIHQQNQPYRRFPELTDLLAREGNFTEQQRKFILLFLARKHKALSYATTDTLINIVEEVKMHCKAGHAHCRHGHLHGKKEKSKENKH